MDLLISCYFEGSCLLTKIYKFLYQHTTGDGEDLSLKQPAIGILALIYCSQSSPGAPGCLTFFSKFESGNLRKAIQVRE